MGDCFGYVFFADGAGVIRELSMRIQLIVRRLDKRRFQPHRIGDDHRDQQIVAMTRDVFHHGGFVAERRAVAPQVSALEMGGGNYQHVAAPDAGRETRPCVRGVVRRMGTTIHENGALHGAEIFEVKCGELARNRIDLLGNANGSKSAPLIRTGVRPALKFGQTPLGVVVTIGFHPAGVIERNALVVSQRRAAGALVGVFGNSVGPDAGQIYLGVRRH